MNIAIILPARLKSSRLPNKLLLDRSGKTVLEHTIERARMALSNDFKARILVAADDEKLIAAAKRAGADAVMTDPNHTSGTDRVAAAAVRIPEEIIVNLQADEPEIDPDSIRQVARLLILDSKAPMATLAVPLHDEELWKKPNVVKLVLNHHGCAMYFSRSPIPYVRDGGDTESQWQLNGKRVYGLHHLGIYAYRREFLLNYKNLPPSKLEKLEKLEQLRALEAGHTIKVGIARSNPPGIDTPEDYEAFLLRVRNRAPVIEAVK